MSGPVDPVDEQREEAPLPGVEAREGRHTQVAGLPVMRVLPTKGRRTVGAWCFVDLMRRRPPIPWRSGRIPTWACPP